MLGALEVIAVAVVICAGLIGFVSLIPWLFWDGH